MKKIGIFSGTFDPVHLGHIAFALGAIEKVGLDEVYFMPERDPRHKISVTDYSHRLNMLNLAIKPFEELKVLEISEPYFTVENSMAKLLGHFKNADLYLLIGSDVAKNIDKWPDVDRFLDKSKLIIGTRSKDSQVELSALLAKLLPISNTYFIRPRYPNITSTAAKSKLADDLEPEVLKYIRSNQLYKA